MLGLVAPFARNVALRLSLPNEAEPSRTIENQRNPDKALRNRTILGMNILTGFKAQGDEYHGQIYDPKSGKTYRSVVYKGKSGNLVVKGCIAFFCQAQTWTPAG